MKVTVNFEDAELEPLIQRSLETGVTVQAQLIEAVTFYNRVKKIEEDDKVLFGYGDKTRFKQYNKVIRTDGRENESAWG